MKGVDVYSQLNVITFAIKSADVGMLIKFIDTEGGVILMNNKDFHPKT
jgi:hypothetical protein